MKKKFTQKYSKNNIIVKYYYNLNYIFFLVYFILD